MSTRDRINEFANIADTQVLFVEPPDFDDAILGITARADGLAVVAYDYMACIEILMRDMDRDEAEEYMSFNVVGAWVGEGTPVFVDRRFAE